MNRHLAPRPLKARRRAARLRNQLYDAAKRMDQLERGNDQRWMGEGLLAIAHAAYLASPERAQFLAYLDEVIP